MVIVREHISGHRVVLHALSESPSIREAAREQDWKALQARVRAMHANAAGFATLFLVNGAGILRATSTGPGLVGQDFSGRDYFRGGRRSTGPYISAPYSGGATREPTVAIVSALGLILYPASGQRQPPTLEAQENARGLKGGAK